jgi:hypothetical protein
MPTLRRRLISGDAASRRHVEISGMSAKRRKLADFEQFRQSFFIVNATGLDLDVEAYRRTALLPN